jgi:hypothetical protein
LNFFFIFDLQFFNLISRNELVPTLLKFRQATVFAPNNEAMRAFTGQKDQDLLLYHLGKINFSLLRSSLFPPINALKSSALETCV